MIYYISHTIANHKFMVHNAILVNQLTSKDRVLIYKIHPTINKYTNTSSCKINQKYRHIICIGLYSKGKIHIK